MRETLDSALDRARDALVSGRSQDAMDGIEAFMRLLASDGLAAGERSRIEGRVAELRGLADAARRGTELALEQIRAIVEATRSLQTYDAGGNRLTTRIAADLPRRF